ncbi:shieldin complex subunit 3, partial [Dendrobates tinctorius]|uniref:shieldin complex subunit 3 n=1 Tax=Dendrobates tinctorius TaxID=92724 RepID=UPI003CCA2ADF
IRNVWPCASAVTSCSVNILQMEVFLHYRPDQIASERLQKLATGSLEEFPLRLLPKFVPWFPNHLSAFTLKPQTCPPLIPVDPSSVADLGSFDPVNVDPSMCSDPTPNLLEFKANTHSTDDKKGAEKDGIVCDAENTYVRSWSVYPRRVGSKDSVIPSSPELKSIMGRLQLNLYHRGRWTILPSVCGSQCLDEVWDKVSRMTRRGVLPSCNATMQRDIGEIWIFCDLRYCEHIGQLVRSQLQPTGKIDFTVHKHGVILRM